MSEQRDYRDTVFLPKTDFPMKAGLPQKEPGIAARWESECLYRQIRKARDGREKFIFHDGPPYANGDIHIGHALNHTLKDMVVAYRAFWDSLPIVEPYGNVKLKEGGTARGPTGPKAD
jgi:isoleucyl-tRNA synthetase